MFAHPNMGCSALSRSLERMAATFRSVVPMIPAGPRLRDAVAFNLVENDNRAWANNASFSISVDDLDALYEEFKDIDVRFTPPEVKAWGRREFHMIVPSGVCLQFYEAEPQA